MDHIDTLLASNTLFGGRPTTRSSKGIVAAAVASLFSLQLLQTHNLVFWVSFETWLKSELIGLFDLFIKLYIPKIVKPKPI